MKLTIKYFGILVDMTSKSEEVFDFKDDVQNLEQVKEMIEEKYNGIQSINYNIAINQVMSCDNTSLKNNDILALLPPFAGG